MLFVSLFGKLTLSLSLFVALFILMAFRVKAIWAADTMQVVRVVLIGLCDWHSTSIALVVAARFESMVDSNPVIEHKAFTLPEAFRFGYFF